MSKALVLGNGGILLNVDRFAQLRDFYFPHVGLENHIGGHCVHRVGVFVDGQLSWTADGSWEITYGSGPDVLTGWFEATNRRLEVVLYFTDVVYNEQNIFLRRLRVKNLSERRRTIRIFFYHQFEPYESHIAHTAYFDPENHVIIHYRNQRVFLLSAQLAGRPFDDFSTGVFASENREGTYVDAEDGVLAKNPIEHGRADSAIGLSGDYSSGEEKTISYWLTAALSIPEAIKLHNYVLRKGVAHMVETTENFWRAWVHRRQFSFYGLEQEEADLFNRSLLLLRAHMDNGGGIIASGDSNSLQKGKDTYAYVWPRDAAFAALALARSGDTNVARRFFSFCREVLADGEYFMHKYSPDKSLGSSWHPWWKNGQPQLPIQEDETALILYALWRYYQVAKDVEFIEELYNPLIKRTADFMVLYRDERLGLPNPSYNLWEEKFGVGTFTAAAVYAGLTAAANFADLLGKSKNEVVYRQAAAGIKKAILEHLYDKDRGVFYQQAHFSGDGEKLLYDPTIDLASVYGVFRFGVLGVGDERLTKAMRRTADVLICGGAPIGGVARYEGDDYYRQDPTCPGNPWFVTTFWLAQYHVAVAGREGDLDLVKKWLRWAVRHSLPSGLLSEQLNVRTGEQLSVAPLVWSHAEYINTVIDYLDKLEEMGICPACNPVY